MGHGKVLRNKIQCKGLALDLNLLAEGVCPLCESPHADIDIVMHLFLGK
jgi:hypothetical protein